MCHFARCAGLFSKLKNKTRSFLQRKKQQTNENKHEQLATFGSRNPESQFLFRAILRITCQRLLEWRTRHHRKQDYKFIGFFKFFLAFFRVKYILRSTRYATAFIIQGRRKEKRWSGRAEFEGEEWGFSGKEKRRKTERESWIDPLEPLRTGRNRIWHTQSLAEEVVVIVTVLWDWKRKRRGEYPYTQTESPMATTEARAEIPNAFLYQGCFYYYYYYLWWLLFSSIVFWLAFIVNRRQLRSQTKSNCNYIIRLC